MYDFFDRDHAANYLGGTVVRSLEQGPTIVHNVDWDRNRRIVVHHIPLRKAQEGGTVANFLEAFDFKPWRLGMYNFTVDGVITEAAWVQRAPARRWKVGFDRNALAVVTIRKADDNCIPERLKERGEMSAWWYNSDMADMLEGKYPTLREALAIIGKRTRCSVAFSRNFAVTGTRKLYYKHNDQPVGKVIGDKDGGLARLNAEYMDLQQILMEDLR